MSDKNSIIIFNNENFGELKTLTINEEPYFIGKDVAKILGYADVNRAVKQHVDKEDLKVCNRKGYGDLYPTLWNNENDFANKVLINESGVYSLIFGSKLPEAKQFKRWITSEILPTLRRSRVVILEDATEEAIDYQSKYGLRRIRKTFTNTKDPRKTYEKFIELTKEEIKAKRLTTEDRIKACKIIIDTLNDKITNNMITMRGSELLAIQELLTEINKDLRIFCNKRSGGLLAAKTKEITKLEDEINYSTSDYYCIERHAFTCNKMNTYNEQLKREVNTTDYKKWKENLNLSDFLPETYPDVDFSKDLKITLLFSYKKEFDLDNLQKAIIDMLQEFYNFDDNNVKEIKSRWLETVETYDDGCIWIRIENFKDNR